MPDQKPLTSRDREQYIHTLRENQNRIAWTVNKSRFGQNDILGCIDTISYTPWNIFLDQTSTIAHISDKRRDIEQTLEFPPLLPSVKIVIHGLDGYRIKQGKKWVPVFTRHVMEEWMANGKWNRVEMPITIAQNAPILKETVSSSNISPEKSNSGNKPTAGRSRQGKKTIKKGGKSKNGNRKA